MASSFNGAARSAIRIAGSRALHVLPYAKLSQEIKQIDIGEVLSIPNVPGAEPVYGRYRRLEWVLTEMAELLLSMNDIRKDLKWFGKPEGAFRYAVGADGARVARRQPSVLASLIKALRWQAKSVTSCSASPTAVKTMPR